jgi:uncharacterized protein (DUF2062 family)
MDYLLLYALLILIAVFNVFVPVLQWTMSLAGLLSIIIVVNLAACLLTHFCPPISMTRRFCASLGCFAR